MIRRGKGIVTAATILFTDIVAYSKRNTHDQKRLINSLNAKVSFELRELLLPVLGEPEVVALPTGDGMALGFLHGAQQAWTTRKIFEVLLHLQEWARSEGVEMRYGIHSGPVEIVNDVNGHRNICGATVNFAQRVMDAANGKQVLLSAEAYHHHIGDATHKIQEPFQAYFDSPVQVTVKHGVELAVYPMKVKEENSQEGAPLLWDDQAPQGKWWSSVALTQMPKEKGAPDFFDLCWQAKQLAFIQLTGGKFLDVYREKRQATELGDDGLPGPFKKELEAFWVFLPSEDLYNRLGRVIVSETNKPLEEFVADWRTLLNELKEERPQLHVKLAQIDTIGYYASYRNWDRPGGVIHVSPAIWGTTANESPGFDFTWHGDAPMPTYEAYVRGLRNLNQMSYYLLDS